ncbi:[FeFe] hydrogenase H-cluster radical SAM maturase HydG [Candidatus Falkowbacteria bacterium]|jgi:2-iminoacetate synthase|nr:[FeFe] hydrogenase H-cluster radical SAM maturase HydG [Candidatus Falkowbacteria bacterium]MBT7007159.1 [FeFe] hydrogenase H-cluster radical SAM maturase HydG [Candidatus Falkowbacteria bacterium]
MSFIDETKINQILQQTKTPSTEQVKEILNIAKQKKGLNLEQTAVLLNSDADDEIKAIANQIKQEIYGDRIVLFAPLYLSSFCVNNCKYCGFHSDNKTPRQKLSLKQVTEQTQEIIKMGHKRILVEVGEDAINTPIDYVVDAIQEIYKAKLNNGEIRRVNVNIAATTVDNYKKLKAIGIGTYQLFQETYHKETYKSLHQGPKADYERQLYAHDKAFQAGLDDLGIGVLFGLYHYKFEALCLLEHANYLNDKYGIGPHTISFPRLNSAPTVDFQSANLVNDQEFLKLIAIMRLAVPYTGMILSTRETPEIRKQAFDLGISQASAASRTAPGGYGKKEKVEQFSLSDHRPLHEVITSMIKDGYLPSFCTACYRIERTGEKFMSIAKRGEIHEFCFPNALLTFQEYLEDYTSDQLKKDGQTIIDKNVLIINNPDIKEQTKHKLDQIKQGQRDLYF